MRLITVICLFLILNSCKSTSKVDKITDEKRTNSQLVTTNIPNVVFDIYQDGKVVIPNSSIIKLKKSPFTIKFEVTKAEGIFLQASYSDAWYQLKNSESIPDRAYVYPKAMAEENFNTDKDLIISNEYYAYWFFDEKDDWYRMSKAEKTLNGFRAEVEVENLFIREPSKEVIKVKAVQKPIYLFVFIPNGDNQEYMRLKYKIEWK